MVSFYSIAKRMQRSLDGASSVDSLAGQMLDFADRRRRNPEFSEYRKPGYHVSGLVKTCARRVIYGALREWFDGIPRVNDIIESETDDEDLLGGGRDHPAIEFQYEIGQAIHEAYQNRILGPSGIIFGHWRCPCGHLGGPSIMPHKCSECEGSWHNLRYEETKITFKVAGVDFHGNVDGLWLDPVSNILYVLEFKTVSKSKYEALRRPIFEHVIQVHGYMRALELPKAIIIYVDRGQPCEWSFAGGRPTPTGLRQKQYEVQFEPELWEQIENNVGDFIELDANIEQDRPKPEEVSDKSKRQAFIDKMLARADAYAPVCDVKSCQTAQNCPVMDICFGL